MNYDISLNRAAIKYLKRLDQAKRKKILLAIEGLKFNPPVGDIVPIKSMSGFNHLRVGSYRAIFFVNHKEKTVYVRTIGHRGNIY